MVYGAFSEMQITVTRNVGYILKDGLRYMGCVFPVTRFSLQDVQMGQADYSRRSSSGLEEFWDTTCGMNCQQDVAGTLHKSKSIPSIFNDESTESFICLRRHI
jgi:hypothetical protein